MPPAAAPPTTAALITTIRALAGAVRLDRPPPAAPGPSDRLPRADSEAAALRGASMCQDLAEEFDSVSRDGQRWVGGPGNFLRQNGKRPRSDLLQQKKAGRGGGQDEGDDVERMKEANQGSRAELAAEGGVVPLFRSASCEAGGVASNGAQAAAMDANGGGQGPPT